MMRQGTGTKRTGILILPFLFFICEMLGLAQASDQKFTLHVENNGVDSSTCGQIEEPCRSITRAIANASPGERIVVGPGRYGDLNGNGILGEAGEEASVGCFFCMININKAVTLVSREGASSTVLDAGGASVLTVAITASGVVFGQPQHGFLITGSGSNFNGLGMFSGLSGVTIAGNISSGNTGAGFGIAGYNTVVTGNQAIGNLNRGFGIFENGNMITDNSAVANVAGGFVTSGSAHTLLNNDSEANGGDGILIQGTAHQLQGNNILGNKGFGINIEPDGGSATITENNIFANNSAPGEGINNCGIHNASGNTISAISNYWGSASGPGGDPADAICDAGDSMTIFIPFAPQKFKREEKEK